MSLVLNGLIRSFLLVALWSGESGESGEVRSASEGTYFGRGVCEAALSESGQLAVSQVSESGIRYPVCSIQLFRQRQRQRRKDSLVASWRLSRR